jgi:hypothetical protein
VYQFVGKNRERNAFGIRSTNQVAVVMLAGMALGRGDRDFVSAKFIFVRGPTLVHDCVSSLSLYTQESLHEPPQRNGLKDTAKCRTGFVNLSDQQRQTFGAIKLAMVL